MVKLLLCGQVNGQWTTVFERAQKLNAAAAKSGAAPFELLFCIGGAFPLPTEFVDGSKRVPLPTYFIAAGEHGDAAWKQDPQQLALYEKLVGTSAAGGDDDGANAAAATAPVQVADNLFFLGKHGITTIEGLKIAFLSGSVATNNASSSDATGGADAFTYTGESVKALIRTVEACGADDVDFLLTADYAAGFQRLLPDQQLPTELQTLRGAPALQELLRAVHPRYHITSCARAADSGVFYQRLPYVSESRASGRKCVTRLIGLCGVSASKNKAHKYLHALQVTPSAGASVEQVDIPAGTTQNPYTAAAPRSPERTSRDDPLAKRRRVDVPAVPSSTGANSGGLSAEQIAQLTAQSARGAQFFYDQKLAARGLRQGSVRADAPQPGSDKRRRSQAAPPLVPERTECWFCLATPSVERHLIVSIGHEAYLAMPKGAINSDHLLIVPIAHAASTTTLSASALHEIERFKRALRELFATQGKDMLVLDRNVQTLGATHCHLQVVGVPRAKAAATRRVFETEGERYRVTFQELGATESLASRTDGKPFFYAEVPAPPVPGATDIDGADTTVATDSSNRDGVSRVVRLLHMVDGKHYMQFGRHAAACVLEVPRRANWKNCVVPKAEEEQMTQAFKQTWKPFDFTADDDDDGDDA